MRQTLSSRWFELVCPSRLKLFDVRLMSATSCSSNFTPFKWRAGRTGSSAVHTIHQRQCGLWYVATRCSPPHVPPTSHSSGSVLVELDLVEDFFCCAHCQRMPRLLSLRIRFPLFSIFLDFLPLLSRCRCFLYHCLSSGLEKSTNFVCPSLFCSSRWSVCLVHGAEAWVPFCCFHCPIVHLVAMQFSLSSAIFPIQNGISAAFILSTAVAVLLFMYSIQFSYSLSPV